jgi:hypothetical protein
MGAAMSDYREKAEECLRAAEKMRISWSASKCWALLAITWFLPIMPAEAKSTRHKQKCSPEIPTVIEFVLDYEVSQWYGADGRFYDMNTLHIQLPIRNIASYLG